MGANTVADFAQIPHSVTISLGNVWMGVNQDISLICVTKVSEINSNVVTHLLSFCHAINFYTKLHKLSATFTDTFLYNANNIQCYLSVRI